MTDDTGRWPPRKSAARRRESGGPAAAPTVDEWAIDAFLGLAAIVLVFVALFVGVFLSGSAIPIWFAIPMSALILGVSFGREAAGDRGRLALWLSVAVLLLVLAGHYVIASFIAVDEQTAKSVGDGVVASIEEFYCAHGRYPEALSTAGIEVPATRMCSWRYELSSPGGFCLTAEGYGFEVYYSSSSGCWQTPDF